MKNNFVNVNGIWYSKEALKAIKDKGPSAKVRIACIADCLGHATIDCCVIDRFANTEGEK